MNTCPRCYNSHAIHTNVYMVSDRYMHAGFSEFESCSEAVFDWIDIQAYVYSWCFQKWTYFHRITSALLPIMTIAVHNWIRKRTVEWESYCSTLSQLHFFSDPVWMYMTNHIQNHGQDINHNLGLFLVEVIITCELIKTLTSECKKLGIKFSTFGCSIRDALYQTCGACPRHAVMSTCSCADCAELLGCWFFLLADIFELCK